MIYVKILGAMLFLLMVLTVIVLVILFKRRSKQLEEMTAHSNADYRKREKEKAIKGMSMLQRQKAAALNEGDVSDLEYDGHTPIIIMEATSNVYEWDGESWIDRFPDQPLYVTKK